MKKIESLGEYNLVATGGWLPVESFCRFMPFNETQVKSLRYCGQWLDGVITKSHRKVMWVNVWEVSRWMEQCGLA